ncbi:hypothetical protein Mal15_28590 [Stieleria maiorica]|uniref:Uncharacterized protein n=1 Tax=Stieleria maiorica TaxID=2795974 RepID=A0A5B9MDE3_9BACT|nr:hypothetical protein [Stieleria maiorica]QEF98803.1 hypothetical protein Mal15_28590 [Stieleria maiorica]
MSDVFESRIELTHRLRRESPARWHEACEFRGAVRKKAKAEGFTRKAANDRAWKEMAHEFPPLTDAQIAAYPSVVWATLGLFPIQLPQLDADGEPKLAHIDFGIKIAIAMLHADSNRSMSARIQTTEIATGHLIASKAENELRQLIALALANPAGFLVGPALVKLRAVAGRLSDGVDRDLSDIDAKWVHSILRSLERMTTQNVFDVVRSDFAIS